MPILFPDRVTEKGKVGIFVDGKQLASLKKMAKRYAAQIPNYEQLIEQHGLPPLKKKKAEADAE